MSLLDNDPLKPRKSLLNPYADSFVPLSRQGAGKHNKSDDTSENIKESSQVMMSESETSNIASGIAKSHVDASHFNKLSLENSTLKNPDDETERPNIVDELEYDLAFLAATFPGVSDQSLADVYFANGGDLDATIEMMNQLENMPEMSNFDCSACTSATPDSTSCICDEASGSS
ncbi:polyadenylate-binding protein-interacting protein 5-like [Aristolochia californica]|uniref:polyadenylate-binding protein-interacting protein 5-like n=1 Tax=Aristolochia californica TaxID=171875 RepID=UPI0035D7E345